MLNVNQFLLHRRVRRLDPQVRDRLFELAKRRRREREMREAHEDALRRRRAHRQRIRRQKKEDRARRLQHFSPGGQRLSPSPSTPGIRPRSRRRRRLRAGTTLRRFRHRRPRQPSSRSNSIGRLTPPSLESTPRPDHPHPHPRRAAVVSTVPYSPDYDSPRTRTVRRGSSDRSFFSRTQSHETFDPANLFCGDGEGEFQPAAAAAAAAAGDGDGAVARLDMNGDIDTGAAAAAGVQEGRELVTMTELRDIERDVGLVSGRATGFGSPTRREDGSVDLGIGWRTHFEERDPVEGGGRDYDEARHFFAGIEEEDDEEEGEIELEEFDDDPDDLPPRSASPFDEMRTMPHSRVSEPVIMDPDGTLNQIPSLIGLDRIDPSSESSKTSVTKNATRTLRASPQSQVQSHASAHHPHPERRTSVSLVEHRSHRLRMETIPPLRRSSSGIRHQIPSPTRTVFLSPEDRPPPGPGTGTRRGNGNENGNGSGTAEQPLAETERETLKPSSVVTKKNRPETVVPDESEEQQPEPDRELQPEADVEIEAGDDHAAAPSAQHPSTDHLVHSTAADPAYRPLTVPAGFSQTTAVSSSSSTGTSTGTRRRPDAKDPAAGYEPEAELEPQPEAQAVAVVPEDGHAYPSDSDSGDSSFGSSPRSLRSLSSEEEGDLARGRLRVRDVSPPDPDPDSVVVSPPPPHTPPHPLDLNYFDFASSSSESTEGEDEDLEESDSLSLSSSSISSSSPSGSSEDLLTSSGNSLRRLPLDGPPPPAIMIEDYDPTTSQVVPAADGTMSGKERRRPGPIATRRKYRRAEQHIRQKLADAHRTMRATQSEVRKLKKELKDVERGKKQIKLEVGASGGAGAGGTSSSSSSSSSSSLSSSLSSKDDERSGSGLDSGPSGSASGTSERQRQHRHRHQRQLLAVPRSSKKKKERDRERGSGTLGLNSLRVALASGEKSSSERNRLIGRSRSGSLPPSKNPAIDPKVSLEQLIMRRRLVEKVHKEEKALQLEPGTGSDSSSSSSSSLSSSSSSHSIPTTTLTVSVPPTHNVPLPIVPTGGPKRLFPEEGGGGEDEDDSEKAEVEVVEEGVGKSDGDDGDGQEKEKEDGDGDNQEEKEEEEEGEGEGEAAPPTKWQTFRTKFSEWWTVAAPRIFSVLSFLTLTGIMWNTATVPYRIAFESYSPWIFCVIDCISDILMILSFVVRVFFSQEEKKEKSSDQEEERENCCSSRRCRACFTKSLQYVFTGQVLYDIGCVFFPGFTYLLPFGTFLNPWWRFPRLFGILKLPGLLAPIESWLEMYYNLVYFRIVKYAFYMLLMIHLFACWWFYSAKSTSTRTNFILYEPVAQGMLYNVLLQPPERYPLEFSYSGVHFRQYIGSVFFSSFYVVGYAAPFPQDLQQSTYGIFVVVCGAVLFATIIGTVSATLFSIGKMKALFVEKMGRIREFLTFKEVDTGIQRQVALYYELLERSGRALVSPEVIFVDLDVALRRRMNLVLLKELVNKVKIFKECEEMTSGLFIEDVCSCLTHILLLKGFDIVRHGDVGRTMYFIQRGSVKVLSEDRSTTYATLGKGQFFGEIALFLDKKRTAHVVAAENCDLYELSKAKLHNILAIHVQCRLLFYKEAQRRWQEVKKADRENRRKQKKSREMSMSQAGSPRESLPSSSPRTLAVSLSAESLSPLESPRQDSDKPTRIAKLATAVADQHVRLKKKDVEEEEKLPKRRRSKSRHSRRHRRHHRHRHQRTKSVGVDDE